MRLNVTRYSLEVIPEGPQDEAFIEEVLGLRREGDTLPLKRVAPIGLSHSIAYLEARKKEAP